MYVFFGNKKFKSNKWFDNCKKSSVDKQIRIYAFHGNDAPGLFSMDLSILVTVPRWPRRTSWCRCQPTTKTAEIDVRHYGGNVLISFTMVRQSQKLNRTVGTDKLDDCSRGLSYL